jgi:hypothetical protein
LNEAWYAASAVARSAGVSAPRVDRRGDIARAAYRLIAERGLEGLRFADIARAAGINNGTLLYSICVNSFTTPSCSVHSRLPGW